MIPRCPRCDRRTRKDSIADHGVCARCVAERRANGRELNGIERDVVISEFTNWLAGRMPSEAIRQEAARHGQTELHVYVAEHARDYLSHGRTRPER